MDQDTATPASTLVEDFPVLSAGPTPDMSWRTGRSPSPVRPATVGPRDPAAGPGRVGFWESLGYHSYGDPWREQRYWGD